MSIQQFSSPNTVQFLPCIEKRTHLEPKFLDCNSSVGYITFSVDTDLQLDTVVPYYLIQHCNKSVPSLVCIAFVREIVNASERLVYQK